MFRYHRSHACVRVCRVGMPERRALGGGFHRITLRLFILMSMLNVVSVPSFTKTYPVTFGLGL